VNKIQLGLIFIISIATSWTSLIHIVTSIHDLGRNKSPWIYHFKTKEIVYIFGKLLITKLNFTTQITEIQVLATKPKNVEYKQVYDWSYVILLHRYEHLCSYLYTYLFTYLNYMYKYYATTILPTCILHTHNYVKTFEN
jgi:hypothetical protein